jgi:hypothetical protein
MVNPFAGLPVAVTSPVLFAVLALAAIVLFLLFNGRSFELRLHSPLVILAIVVGIWLLPLAIYAAGRYVPNHYSATLQVVANRRYDVGRNSRWILSLREPRQSRTYDFTLAGPGAFRSVDLAGVAAGSCLAVSGAQLPGLLVIYDAAHVLCR